MAETLLSLNSRKQELQDRISTQKKSLQNLKNYCTELETVSYNVDAILDRTVMKTEIVPVQSATHHKSPKERKEKTL